MTNMLSGQNSMRASDQIEAKLRRMIISLELAPGAKLSEAELIETLQCGRTPLREALQRLADQYLIDAVPRRGISIAELSMTDYVQLIETVAHIEGITAMLAAQRSSNEELQILEKIISQAEKAHKDDDILMVADLDFEFHQTISIFSKNRFFKDIIEKLHRLTSRFIYLAWKNGGGAVVSIREHQEIYQAIKDRDPEKARDFCFNHTMKSKERIIQAL